MQSLINRGYRKARRILRRGVTTLRSPLRAAVIGCGEIAPDHIDGYENSGLARTVAVSDLRPAALAGALDRWPGLRAYRDYRQMLREVRPEVVSICTWPQSHAGIVEACAAEGVRGILCEKPLALTLDELGRIEAVGRDYSCRLAGGYQYRFHPAFVRSAGLIRSGTLGSIVEVHGEIRGSLANNGPHLIDAVRFLLGDPLALKADCRCVRERNDLNRGIAAEDESCGDIVFEGDVQFRFVGGDLARNFFRIDIQGTHGQLAVTPAGMALNGVDWGKHEPDCRTPQFRAFLEWVRGRRGRYEADLEQSVRSNELVLALYQSARERAPVRLPLQERGDIIGSLFPDGPVVAEREPNPAADDASGVGPRLAEDGGPRSVTRWYSTAPRMGVPEMANLARVIASRHLNCVEGRMVARLERDFALHYGSPRAVASTSGTAAIHVALGALGLEPGDEVLTTPLTDMGTVIPILASNCLPIFADVDPRTGNLTAETIAEKLSPRTKAVILVHLFGRPAELDPIVATLRERGISLIEDCSQAHAAEYRGRMVGTFGDFGCFSLQQSKQITCGDGGLTLVNREDLAERAALFVDKGWDRRRGARGHLFLGMNYRMTELQGAVALAQLRRLPGLILARRASAAELSYLLAEIPGIEPPTDRPEFEPSWWTYPFAIDEQALGLTTDELADAILVEGVRVRRAYLPAPVFEFEVLKHQRTFGKSRFPFSAFAYEPPDIRQYPGLGEFQRRLLFLTWSHNVRSRHVREIAKAVRRVVACRSRRSPDAPELSGAFNGRAAATMSGV